MDVLAIIPARGGSKGIPRKNVRLMCGKPLIYYAIHNAQTSELITDVVVSSDDDEILTIAEMYHSVALRRPSRLAGDHITLDPVVYEAVQQMEARRGKRYDIVITLQPTSPVLTSKTLNTAIRSFMDGEVDTCISATNRPHLSWSKNETGFYPLYEHRLNRQQLPPNYLEAGAFLISRRECVTENSRIGKRISIYEVPEQEAIDIDTANDWIVCENILSRKKIVLRADGYKELGMGHIYHCLTLAYNLIGHEIMFVTKAAFQEGVEKLKSTHFPVTVINSDEEFFAFLETYRPNIVVNDCLDTTVEYVKRLKSLCPRVVTIEDMGEGTYFADVVINALYSGNETSNRKNVYSGEDFVCLRDEFCTLEPKEFSPEVKEVIVLFGGTDPSNLTGKLYQMIQCIHTHYPDIHFTIITGMGYDCTRHGIVTDESAHVTVIEDAKFISSYIKKADLAFTSQGRTVYELAVCGTPSIVLAQNRREQLHSFAQMQNGFFNLGMGNEVEMDTLISTFKFLVNTPQMRREMRELMLSHHHQLKFGVKNEIKLIIGE